MEWLLLSFSRDCASRDFSSLSFMQIFDELYLTQFVTKTLDNLHVDLYTYILSACKFVEPENASLNFRILRNLKTLNNNISWNIKQNNI